MPTETTTVEMTTEPAAQDVAPETTTGQPETGNNITRPTTTGKTPPWGDDFDPQRAWDTIQNLRQFEDETKRLTKDLDEARQALKAIDDEKLSETERLQNRVTELEAETEKAAALAEELERSNKALSAHVETLRDGVPADVLVLLDDKSLPEQLEWLSANRDKYVARDNDKPPTKGIPGTPKPNSDGIPDDERRKRAAMTWRS